MLARLFRFRRTPRRSRSLTRTFSTVTWVVALGTAASPSAACLFAADEAYQFDRSTPASEAPTPPLRVEASVWRRLGELCRDGLCESSSCGDTGGVSLDFDANDRVGYRIVLVDGRAPASLKARIEAGAQGSYSRVAKSGITFPIDYDDVPTLNAEIAIALVNSAGKESVLSEPIHVGWNGCTFAPTSDECVDETPAGCGLAPRYPGAWTPAWGVAAIFAVGLRRRRHAQRRTARTNVSTPRSNAPGSTSNDNTT